MGASQKEEVKPADDDESFKDNTYQCCDCNQDWVDTADDQQFRWDKGFAETPKRCKDCRWAKKVRMEGGDPEAKGKSKGKKGKSGDNALTVFVRGLPFSTTEEVLQKDFAECGELVSCRMPLNDEGSCKGIAFIAFQPQINLMARAKARMERTKAKAKARAKVKKERRLQRLWQRVRAQWLNPQGKSRLLTTRMTSKPISTPCK